MLSKLSLSLRIAKKETVLFYSSPTAYLYLAGFTAVTLFIFFWVEAFFSRNIADVRPLFEWMPVLMIFLASTLTMRLWSEEKRTGTIEHVLTQSTGSITFVLGKFWACLKLLTTSLLLTLPLPISVGLVANLDWGPVWAGYLASLLLGGAYLSIGLFASSRSQNQIVSLLTSVGICSVFYFIGSPQITELFGNDTADYLRLLGTGSRFESITRGVLDLRDLAYYLGLIGAFLSLNVIALEAQKWSTRSQKSARNLWRTAIFLVLANLIVGNLWIGQIRSLRVDLTEGNIYSISEPTEALISELREPLLIRGYFSTKTHPLLAPLVPRIKDMLRELESVSQGKVRVEIVDPTDDPEAEQEANEEHGIKPVPFKVADRYQSAIVSSYFNILIKYGDQSKVLGFKDLIEVKAASANDLQVKLRNPEYDIARAIKKLSESYEASGKTFQSIQGDIKFIGYISPKEKLPQQLQDLRKSLEEQLAALKEESDGRLQIEFVDPDAGQGEVAKEILEKYGFQPMATDFVSPDRFYFYLTLQNGDTIVPIPLQNMSGSKLNKQIKDALLRFKPGSTKTIALVTKNEQDYRELKTFLADEYSVVTENLEDGSVDSKADALLILAPETLDETQLFAVDQFLMQGGTTIVSASPFTAVFQPQSLKLEDLKTGLAEWLSHFGLDLEDTLVMDPQNTSLPIPVARNVGGMVFQEIRQVDYPFFVDVRPPGLNEKNPVTSNLGQATFAYASPIKLDQEKLKGADVVKLVQSSAQSWTTSHRDIMPNFNLHGQSGFVPSGKTQAQVMGVAVTKRFTSFFKGKESAGQFGAGLTHSPDKTKLILFSSNDFLKDRVAQMTGSANGTSSLSNFQLLNNAIDWSLDESGLNQIRSRGHFNRTLPTLSKKAQLVMEYGNYVVILALIFLVGLVQTLAKKQALSRYTDLTNL